MRFTLWTLDVFWSVVIVIWRQLVSCRGRLQCSLHNLHWLPIRICIMFKVATLCYKAYRLIKPSYLHAIWELYVPRRRLRYAEMDLVAVPRSRSTPAACSFSSAAPTVWNRLPLAIPYSSNVGLRSAEMDLLAVSRSRTKLVAHCLSSDAPTVWNGLPLAIRNSSNIWFTPRNESIPS